MREVLRRRLNHKPYRLRSRRICFLFQYRTDKILLDESLVRWRDQIVDTLNAYSQSRINLRPIVDMIDSPGKTLWTSTGMQSV